MSDNRLLCHLSVPVILKCVVALESLIRGAGLNWYISKGVLFFLCLQASLNVNYIYRNLMARNVVYNITISIQIH